MSKLAALLLPLVALLPMRAGGKKFDPQACARTVAPFVNEQTLAVGRLDMTRLDADAAAERLAELLAGEDKPTAEEKRDLRQWLTRFTRAGGKELYLVFDVSSFPELTLVVVPLEAGAEAKTLAKLLESVGLFRRFIFEKHGPGLVGGHGDALNRLAALKPQPRPDLARAFEAAGDGALQLLIVPTADQRRVFEELIPALPPEVGGGSSKVLTRGIVWLAAGVQLTPKMSLQVVIQSQDAAAARNFSAWSGRALELLTQNPQAAKRFPHLDKLRDAWKPEVVGDRVRVKLDGEVVRTTLMPLLGNAQLSSARAESVNNLKQIGLALHSYHDALKAFPTAASHDKQGKPLLSWRVHILPYLEQENLYRQFNLDEPWDSAHNKKLIPLMPKVYDSPLSRLGEPGKTTYLAPVGAGTMFEGRKGLGIRDVPDGTSNTVFVVDAADDRAVIWTKPDDLPFDPKQPARGLFDKKRREAPALFVDGSAQALPATLMPETFRRLFQRNDGEPIGELR
jgi:hypothetical protein